MTGIKDIKFLTRPVQNYETGGPVDIGKEIKVPESKPPNPIEPKPILQREEKVKVNWKAVGNWLKDFHNQKHPFQKSTGKTIQPTKVDRIMYTILDPRKKVNIFKNIALNVGQKVAPELTANVQKFFDKQLQTGLDLYKNMGGDDDTVTLNALTNKSNQLAERTSTGELTSAEKNRRIASNFSKTNVENRISTFKNFSENEEITNFLNDSKKLYDLPTTGTISKYNDLNYLTQVSKIFNNANEYERLLLNDSFNKIANGKGRRLISTLNDNLKKAKLPEIPLSQAGTGASALNPLKDEALIVGVNNLKNYAEANINIDPTGSQLNLKELKKIMFPNEEDQKYLQALGGDSTAFNRIVTNVIKNKETGFGNEFPEKFNEFGGTFSITKTRDEFQKALQNKNFADIVGNTGLSFNDAMKAIEGKNYKLTNINVVGSENKKIIDSVVKNTQLALKDIDNVSETTRDKINNQVNMMIHRTFFEGFKQNNKTTINEMMEYVKNVDTKKLAEIINDREVYSDMLNTYKKLEIDGFDPLNLDQFSDEIQIGHLKALMDNYRLGLEADNLFLQDKTQNIKSGNWTKTAIELIDDVESNPSTKAQNKLDKHLKMGEKEGYVAEVRQYSIGDPSVTPLTELESTMKERISDVMMGEPTYFKKDGGMVGISHLTRSL